MKRADSLAVLVALGATLLGRQLPSDPCGYADREHTLWHDHPGRHDGPRSDERFAVDCRTVEHDGPDPDQGPVPDAAAVHHGAVADGDLLTEGAGKAPGSHVEHRVVLNVRAVADADVVHVPAQHAPVPDAGVLANLDISDNGGTRGHPGTRMHRRPHAAIGAQSGLGGSSGLRNRAGHSLRSGTDRRAGSGCSAPRSWE